MNEVMCRKPVCKKCRPASDARTVLQDAFEFLRGTLAIHSKTERVFRQQNRHHVLVTAVNCTLFFFKQTPKLRDFLASHVYLWIRPPRNRAFFFTTETPFQTPPQRPPGPRPKRTALLFCSHIPFQTLSQSLWSTTAPIRVSKKRRP